MKCFYKIQSPGVKRPNPLDMGYLQWRLEAMRDDRSKERIAYPANLSILIVSVAAGTFLHLEEGGRGNHDEGWFLALALSPSRVYVILAATFLVTFLGAMHALKLERYRGMCLRELHRRYDLSEMGFLPRTPVGRLSSADFPEFKAWEGISTRMPELIRGDLKTFRSAVLALPCATADDLSPVAKDGKALRRLYVLFGQLVHSWVHGHLPSWDSEEEEGPDYAWGKSKGGASERAQPPMEEGKVVVPAQLAVPFRFACEHLGLPMVLTAAGTDCWNWRLPGSTGASPEEFEATKLEQLHCVSSITGTDAERYFHMVPCAMQAAAGSILPDLLRIPEYLCSSQNYAAGAALIKCLDGMERVLRAWRVLFDRIPGLVDRRFFFDVYRHILNGFYPHGIVLRLDPNNRPGKKDETVAPKGPSAGQSTIVMIFDKILGVRHAAGAPTRDDEASDGSEMRSFQHEMRSYMPGKHRMLLEHFDTAMRASGHDSVRHYLAAGEGGRWRKRLQTAYDGAATALADLRRTHLGVVTAFLTRTNTGTGASSFRSLLQEALDNTSVVVGTGEKGANSI